MNWKKIIVHCSATPNGDARFDIEDYRKWHKAKGWRDVGYNYVVEVDGRLSKGRAETGSGAHTTGQNSVALGICMTGTDKFYAAQFETLRAQILAWMKQYKIKVDQVFGHYQFAAKTCPGYKIELLRKYIETGDLNVMKAHLLAYVPANQPGDDMGGEEEAAETKALVRSIQRALNELLDLSLSLDGIMGPKTKAALVKLATN